MTSQLNLLIAEDDPHLITALKLLVPNDFKVYVTQNPDLIPDHVFFHAALVDMHIKTEQNQIPDGPKLIEKLIKKNPQTEIISMSGNLNRQNMEMSIKAGAQRFLAKPLSPDEVTLVLSKILAYWQIRQLNSSKTTSKVKLIGLSDYTESLRKKIASLKSEKNPILIQGETGTGKEVSAVLLNQQEGQIPFVTINCSAITENLFESELFGHVKGAFTGADQNKIGLIEAAHGGDLFLDEIEALPLSQQAKLLRFLETGEIRKLGAKENQWINTRVISASNENLNQLISEKKFREDLYYRLSAHKIDLQSLNGRVDDIIELATYFIELEKPKRNKTWTPEALKTLSLYSWPGNIRELKRVCEQITLLAPLPFITNEDVIRVLPKDVSPTNESNDFKFTLSEYIAHAEKKFIEFHLLQEKNLDLVAETIKISKSNLYKKIKDYNITYE